MRLTNGNGKCDTRCNSNIFIRIKKIEGKEQLKIKDDNAIAFSCANFWVRSGGKVWTSEFMQMRCSELLLFTAEQNENLERIKSTLNKICIKLMDTLKSYEISSQKNYVLNTSLNETESCSNRQYEMNRFNNLLPCLDW